MAPAKERMAKGSKRLIYTKGTVSHWPFTNHGLTTRTKIMIFGAVVLSTLLYAWETWTLFRSDFKGWSGSSKWSPEKRSPTMRFSLWTLSQVSGLPSFNIDHAGRVTCLECVPLVSHVSSCLESSPSTSHYTVSQNDASGIRWRPLWHRPTSTMIPWKLAANHPSWCRKIMGGDFLDFRIQPSTWRGTAPWCQGGWLVQPFPPSTLICDSCSKLFRSGLGKLLSHRHQGWDSARQSRCEQVQRSAY